MSPPNNTVPPTAIGLPLDKPEPDIKIVTSPPTSEYIAVSADVPT